MKLQYETKPRETTGRRNAAPHKQCSATFENISGSVVPD